MKKIEKYMLLPIVLNLFDGTVPPAANPNTVTTGSDGMSSEMKTYYDKRLIDYAEPELIYNQFGQKRNIPKGSGKTIEFRSFDPLPELTTPLAEGVTPDGQPVAAKSVTSTVQQYGGYTTYSDMVSMTTIDPLLEEMVKLIGSQAGRSLDAVTREYLNAGTVVQYAAGQVASRGALYYTSETDNCNITAKAVRRAVLFLEEQSASKIDGFYVGFIHPRCKYDLMNDPEWRKPHDYVDTSHIYRNEIGEIGGVRFIESPRAKKWEKAGTADADVFSTLIFGADAYGVTELDGGGMETIIKPVGSAGASDPLNQRGTVGWKGTTVTTILIPQYLVRVETTATK